MFSAQLTARVSKALSWGPSPEFLEGPDLGWHPCDGCEDMNWSLWTQRAPYYQPKSWRGGEPNSNSLIELSHVNLSRCGLLRDFIQLFYCCLSQLALSRGEVCLALDSKRSESKTEWPLVMAFLLADSQLAQGHPTATKRMCLLGLPQKHWDSIMGPAF